MKVQCDKCGQIDDYNPKKTTKNRRKTCSRCGHKYKVTPQTNPVVKKQQTITIKEDFFLSELDILILGVLKSSHPYGKYQSQIAKITKYSAKTVRRHLLRLKKEGLVKEEPTSYPKIWTLRPDYYSKTHGHKFICKLMKGVPKIQPKKTVQMTNWKMKIFEIYIPRYRVWIQNAQLTPKNIIFWVETNGKNSDYAEEKAKKYAFMIQQYLEKKYQIKISHPIYQKEEGKQDSHTLPSYGIDRIDPIIKTDDPTISDRIFTDSTPEPNTIETPLGKGEHQAWFDRVNTDIPEIKDDIREMKEQFSDFRTVVTKLSDNIKSLAENMKQLSQNQTKVNEKMVEGFKTMTEVLGQGIQNILQKNNKTEQNSMTKEDTKENSDREPSNIYL